jgi:hypothetical protein
MNPDAIRRLTGIALAVALPLTIVPSVVAATPSTDTFRSVIGEARLVVLVRIHHASSGRLVLDVERVLKGSARRRLTFQPGATDVPLYAWAQAVIAFRDPPSLDFRSPTIAWHVSAGGRIDPEHYQQYPGTPRTLRGFFAALDLPATSTASLDPEAPMSPSPLPMLGSGLLGVIVFATLLRRWRPAESAEGPMTRPTRFNTSPQTRS